MNRQLLWVLAVATLYRTAHSSKTPQLRFRADGTFHIVQLADLHYGHSPEDDAHTDKVRGPGLAALCTIASAFHSHKITLLYAQVVESILALERPDLAVLSGDMVSGFMWDTKPGWFEKRYEPAQGLQHHPDSVDARETHDKPPCMRRWRQLTKPLLAAGVPHALVLGNHDDEADLMRAQIVALDQRLKVRCALAGRMCACCAVLLASVNLRPVPTAGLFSHV